MLSMTSYQTRAFPMSSRIRRIGIKFFIFSVCVLFLVYFFGPYHLLKNYVLSEMRKSLIQNQSFLNPNIRSLTPYWLSGIELKNVTLQNIYENQRHPFIIENMNSRLSLLPLLIGH